MRFWVDFAGFWIARLAVDDASEDGLSKDGGKSTDADADKGQSGDADFPAAMFGEDDGIGDEAEVENGVDNRDPGLSKLENIFRIAMRRARNKFYQKFINHKIGSVANRINGRLKFTLSKCAVDTFWSY